MVLTSAIVIHVFRNNKHQEKETINERELWPVEFYLLHEPKMEKQYEWFVTTEKYFQNYDSRLLIGIGRKEALKVLSLAMKTNNAERVTKNSCQVYRISGFIMKNKEAKFLAKNGNDKLASVQISRITAFRIIASSKNQKR
jgi:hypothetical protein